MILYISATGISPLCCHTPVPSRLPSIQPFFITDFFPDAGRFVGLSGLNLQHYPLTCLSNYGSRSITQAQCVAV